ncbi:MAG: YncE family protein, partial [Candidatus Omnitrophica bacterium]|nr:YncE family protein [Candidatus Omnitrophota bacterium]
MNQLKWSVLVLTLAGLWNLGAGLASDYASPLSLIADPSGGALYIAEDTGQQVAIFDIESETVTEKIPLNAPPTSLALTHDGNRLYVATASPKGQVAVIDIQNSKIIDSIPVGHTPQDLALSPDGSNLYVCNRFDNEVAVIDTETKQNLATIPVLREPVACALTPDGSILVVANHLPTGPGDGEYVAAKVTLIDTQSNNVSANIQLPNGSTSLRGACVSPDGKYAYVTHILGRFHLPTTQLERGWMNTNALSVIDLEKMELLNTVLLDNVDLGAANPWGVVCTSDGRFLCVSHAGTHEVSVIDRSSLHEKLAKVTSGEPVTEVSISPEDVPNDLAFLVSIRRRLKLEGEGPRGLAVIGSRVYAAEYFTDSLGILDIDTDARPHAKSVPLKLTLSLSEDRRGEKLFHDATACFQHWQSCSSCHPDARVDGLNWDLLNDGMGNPKNTKNMLLAHQTPPAMSTGIRGDAETAVRAGIRFIFFVVPPEEDAEAIDAYLKSLEPVPSPHLVNGELSESAQRGKAIFEKARCNVCHPA